MALVCLLLLLVVVLPAEVTAQLDLLYNTPQQNRLENRITIGCYENTFPVNSAQFWVRREGLAIPDQLQSLVTVQRPQPHQVAFVITQDLEGSYFCSLNNVFSNSVEIVAYPRPDITIPLFYLFQRGQSATIDCRVMPGRLSQYYRVSWWNDTFQIATSNPRFVFPGYQLHDNFSLTIYNIQTSDSSTSYQCMVTIDDPQIRGTTIDRHYDQSELGTITVVVYDTHPRIVTPPQPVVTAVVDGVQHNTTFNCTTFGDPTPHISWIHNMLNISQNGRFQVMVTEDGRSRNSSTLAINSLTATDSGIIQCVANNSLGVDYADTTLSVLTSDFNLTVTVAASVRFMVTLFEGYIIPQPVRLRILFISAEAARTETTNITSETYVNTSRMIHEVPNSEVPYIQFNAQVALTVGSEMGPFVPNLDSAPVYQIPRIETLPEPGVVAVADGETRSTTFTCTAAAVNVTVLQISWIHNGQILNQGQGGVEIMEERGALSLVTSRLTLHNLTAEDNGIIQCVADDPTDMTSTSANTTLSVLTDDFQLGVVVTAEGNLMLTVTLQTAIPGPVKLRIKYTWAVQPVPVEQTTSTTFENRREIVHMVFRSEVPFQQFRFQVALVVDRVVGPFVPDLENATVITLPTAQPSQSSGLIISLSVLVPFSVLLVLIIGVTVPAVIFKMRKKKVETIQDYASTAIELLSKGNPIQLPPQPPPHPPPHLPRQHPQQCPPRLPSHDNTIITSESSSINDGHSQTHPEDLEHHRGSQSVSINTGKQNKSETLPNSTHPSHHITRTDTSLQPSQPSLPITRTDTPSQPLQPTTRTDTPSQPSRNGNVDHLIADWMPTETSRREMTSKDNFSKGASSNGEHNIVGTGYERIATYETVGDVYDKIGTCETIIPTSSAAHPTPRTDAPTQEETASKNKISKRASFVNKGGQNMATAASVSNSQESSRSSPPLCASESVGSSEGAKVTDSVHKKTPPLHGEGQYEQLGSEYDRIATYETVGNVYDKIGTYETIGNVYDKIGTYETITATSSAAHPTPRSDTLTQEETASSDNNSVGASANEGGLNMATAAGVTHFQESSKHSPPVCVSGGVGSSEGAMVTDLATYETVGNVYDRICTYETIGNVYDNSLVPKLGFDETSLQPCMTSSDCI